MKLLPLFIQLWPGGVTNLAKKRIAGAVKVLLTNLPSFIYVLIIGTSALLVIKLGSSGDIATENDGWERFFVVNMFPVLSSVWNPVVFIALTPKSRIKLKSKMSLTIWMDDSKIVIVLD